MKRAFQKAQVAHLAPGRAGGGAAASARRCTRRPGTGAARPKTGGVALDMGKGGRDAEDAEFEKY